MFHFETTPKRSVYLFEPIGAYSVQAVIKDLLKLSAENGDPINLFINSPGGSVFDAFAVIDVMNAINAPVNTIVLGSAASAASLIAAFGAKRFITENSQMMVHAARIVSARGDLSADEVAYLGALNSKILGLYAQKTNAKKIELFLKNKKDNYIDAKQALEIGFADAILSTDEIKKLKLSELSSLKFSEEFNLSQNETELKKLHLLKVCSLKGRGIEITAATLEALKSNFEANVRGQEISIDYTHENDSGEKKAGAWIKGLEIEGENLYAMVELTPAAAEMVKNKEYKYLSVEIDPLYETNEGKRFSNVLLGGTFTNRPAVKGLDPIKLSENNQPKIDMILENSEVQAIEALKAEGLEVKDFHQKFIEMRAENQQLLQAKASIEQKATEFEAAARSAAEMLQREMQSKVDAEKARAVEDLIKKGVVVMAQKDKILQKFASKEELEDFYASVPALVKVQASGSDITEAKTALDQRLEQLSAETKISVEDFKKYGLKL